MNLCCYAIFCIMLSCYYVVVLYYAFMLLCCVCYVVIQGEIWGFGNDKTPHDTYTYTYSLYL